MRRQGTILAALASLLAVQALRKGRRTKSRSIAGVEVRNDRAGAEDWIVAFKDGVSNADIESFCRGRCELMGHPDQLGVAFAKVRSSAEMEVMVHSQADVVEYLEPDEIDHIFGLAAAEETVTAASWGLDSVGVSRRPARGKGVTIYVQDTGIRFSHNDFGGRAKSAIDVTSGKVVECKGSTSCALDRAGHGTHCAGTAAGNTYGVANQANIRAMKTLGDQGSGSRSWQYAAIDWVTSNSGGKHAVISMSLGGSGASSTYTKSIGAATNRGITVVVAAGNENSDTCDYSPGFVKQAITVGATTRSNSRASYSNFGKCNDIMAPGSKINSASVSGDSKSTSKSGTSMACPHVSGAVAVLLELNPSLYRDGVMSKLAGSAKRGIISSLQRGDPDLFLWVANLSSSGPSPPPRRRSSPPPRRRSGDTRRRRRRA